MDYPPQLKASLSRVETTREKRLSQDFPVMSPQEKEKNGSEASGMKARFPPGIGGRHLSQGKTSSSHTHSCILSPLS